MENDSVSKVESFDVCFPLIIFQQETDTLNKEKVMIVLYLW